MRSQSLARFIILAAILCGWGLPRPGGVTAAVPPQSVAAEHVSVLFLIDDSGSMEGNDPGGLRYTAAQLLVALLEPGDQAGALRFSSGSQALTPQLVTLAGGPEQAELARLLEGAQASGYTDVKAAFLTAGEILAASDRGGNRVVVILITDGVPEIAAPYPQYEGEALAAARALGLPVFSVALTAGGQSAFLNRLAAETGGQVLLAPTAAGLLDAYLQILGALKDRSVLVPGADGALVIDPGLAPYVERASFVAVHAAGSNARLVDPTGAELPASPAAQPARFTLASVTRPAGGAWRFAVEGGAQARAILTARLRARVQGPGAFVEAGQPALVAARLVEEQPGGELVNIIGEASFRAEITRPDGGRDSLDRLYDDGTHGDERAGDGVFTRAYTPAAPGSYALRIEGAKGVVPVAAAAQFTALAFPQPVVAQPSAPLIEVRGEPVALRLQLDPADSVLEAGGFEALVRAPDGQEQRVPLAPDGAGGFNGGFVPTEDGAYVVAFQPVGAVYHGLPYRHAASTLFEARVIPGARVESARLGLGEGDVFERSEAQAGLPLALRVHSGAAREIRLTPRLYDLPGFRVAEAGGVTLLPGANDLTLHLVGEPGLPLGERRGRLVLEAPQGVDLTGGETALAFEIYEPELWLTPVASPEPAEGACWQPETMRIDIDIISTSRRAETLTLALDGLPGVELEQGEISVPPGGGRVSLRLRGGGAGGLAAGTYEARLLLAAPRAGLRVSTPASMPVTLRAPSLWTRCQKPMIILGVVLLLAVTMVARGALKARVKARPPQARGTLAYWRKDAPAQVMEVDLEGLRSSSVRIGRASHNEVVVDGEGMEDEHAVILAEWGEDDQVRLTLVPRGRVLQGYRAVTAALPLEADTQFTMGNHVFRYIAPFDWSSS